MLYETVRHIKIEPKVFDPEVIKNAISYIVEETNQQSPMNIDSLWPIHPKDREKHSPEFLTDFYFGAAGVVWALAELKEFSKIDLNEYCIRKINQVLAYHLQVNAKLDIYDDRGSYFVGEAGIRAVKEKLDSENENSSVLLSLIQSKIDSEQNELLYGLPGALLIHYFIFHRKNPSQTRKILDVLLKKSEVDPSCGAKIWHQNFGKRMTFFGSAHGTIGNYAAILKVIESDIHSFQDLRTEVILNIEKLLKFYAKIENDKCNWPRLMSQSADEKYLVHWCHGATGIITDLATKIPINESEIIDDLLIKAGNLVWQAGPLEKGVSLCHGTAGSGMAMLKLYERTKDPTWLQRSQIFAMQAVDQFNSELQSAGQMRFSLWTGDLGLAIFLKNILQEKSNMPGLDYF